MITEQIPPPTFESLFFNKSASNLIRIPDYQRAFAWDTKQIDLFIGDLEKYGDFRPGNYYFGHFIIENFDGVWETVDGQQRVTTFVLFLMVCRHLLPTADHPAFSLIERFFTVSYDDAALKTIGSNLGPFFDYCRALSRKDKLADAEIISRCSLKPETFTLSQQRIASALRQFYLAFEKGGQLKDSRMADYIDVVMKANCSYHLASGKSVAVNVFEMHNTRGVPLTTIEIVKAKLMKFVYDYGGEDQEQKEQKVRKIQEEFGEIYRREELLSEKSFRGDLTLEQLLRLHLMVIDDGSKKSPQDFLSPPSNADSDALIKYLDDRMQYEDSEQKNPKDRGKGVEYALAVAREFRKSVQLIGEFLPQWDKEDNLVGDTLILERDLSCQFFLLVGRLVAPQAGELFGRVGSDTLTLWERLLFTRDLHDKYHWKGKSHRDKFEKLFEEICTKEANIGGVILRYVQDGFRSWNETKDLQKLVSEYLRLYRPSILNGAFYWWKDKMKYVIYKYEVSTGAKIREVMKGTPSVEHILPQEWRWIKDTDEDLKKMSEDEWDSFGKEIDACINGVGNLLLITKDENSSLRNAHPAEKRYEKYCEGGSYKEHDENPEKWRSSKEWSNLIQARGEEIFNFMIGTLVGSSANPQDSSTQQLHA